MSLAFARAFRAFLISDPNVLAALPGGIHPDTIPQESVLPAAAYSVSSAAVSSISGPLPVSTVELTVSIIANNPTQVEAANTAIKRAIKNANVHIIKLDTIIAGLRVSSNTVSSESLGDGDDEPYHTGELNVSGWVTES